MTVDRSAWPVPIESLGPSSVATVVFRHRAAFHLAVVVKGSFQWVQGGRAQPMEAAPIERLDRPWDGDPMRSVERPMEIAPFLPRAEVLVTGHAYAPPGAMVPAASVRLGVFRDVARAEKTVHVYGDRRTLRDPPRPFQRMPLRWELAFGGAGTANPVGTGAHPNAQAPNLLAPDDPARPAGFGAVPRMWPLRAARAAQLHGLDPPVYDLEDELDFAVFQSAPDDQQLDGLHGDEWILLDGVHPSLPRLSTQLPAARPAALVWCEHGACAGMRWSPPLALDMVLIDADRLRMDVVWRGSFTLPEGDTMVPDIRAAAGLETDAPLAWPDVDAALRTRRQKVQAPRAEDGPPVDRTQAFMAPAGEVLPFAAAGPVSTARNVAIQATGGGAAPATPWEVPAEARPPMQSLGGTIAPGGDGDTPVPKVAPLGPVLPFAAVDLPDGLGDVTDADGGEDVESTFDAMATSSTAPPAAGDVAEAPVPPPPMVPVIPPAVVVPPPAVGSARMLLGTFSLGYSGDAGSREDPASEGARLSPRMTSQPPAPPLPAPPPRELTPLAMPAVTWLPGDSSPPEPPEPPESPPVARPPSSVPPPVARPPSHVPPPVVPPRAPAPAPSSPPAAMVAPPADDPRSRVARKLAAKEAFDGADLARLDLSGLDFSGVALGGANLAGATLRGCRFVGARLTDAKLGGADLEGADLERADLTRADLARAKLIGARLVGATVAGTVFQGADATGADLTEAKGARASFARTRLIDAKLVRAELPNGDLSSAMLDRADLSGAQLADAVLDDVQGDETRFDGARLVRVRAHGARLLRANLDGVDASSSAWDRGALDGASMVGAILTDASLLRTSIASASLGDADLRGAKLANAVADDAVLERARLDGADLRQARFEGARFDGAKLVKLVGTKASLIRASFVGAELRGANLRGAKMKGVDLKGASLRDADLRDADLEGARFDGAECAGARLHGANLEGATGLDPALDVDR